MDECKALARGLWTAFTFRTRTNFSGGARRRHGLAHDARHFILYMSDPLVLKRPISVYRLGEMPIQSCGQSINAPCGKASGRWNAHTELRAKRLRSAWEAIHGKRPIEVASHDVMSITCQALGAGSDRPS